MQYHGQETTPDPLRNAFTASLPTSAGVRKRTRSSVNALKSETQIKDNGTMKRVVQIN